MSIKQHWSGSEGGDPSFRSIQATRSPASSLARLLCGAPQALYISCSRSSFLPSFKTFGASVDLIRVWHEQVVNSLQPTKRESLSQGKRRQNSMLDVLYCYNNTQWLGISLFFREGRLWIAPVHHQVRRKRVLFYWCWPLRRYSGWKELFK